MAKSYFRHIEKSVISRDLLRSERGALWALMLSAFWINIAAGLFVFAYQISSYQNEMLRGSGTNLDDLDTVRELRRDSEILSELLEIGVLKGDVVESSKVAILKGAMPEDLSLFEFEEVEDIFSYLEYFGMYERVLRLTNVVLEKGAFFEDFDCDNVASCPEEFKTRQAVNKEADAAVFMMRNHFMPALFKLAESRKFDAIEKEANAALKEMGRLDFAFDYDSYVQREFSKMLLILSFIDVRSGSLTPAFVSDLEAFYSEPVDKTGIGGTMSSEAVRLYRNGIELYYSGCFFQSSNSLETLRRVTSHQLLNEMSIILQYRAFVRPLIRLDRFVEKSENGSAYIKSCEKIFAVEGWLDSIGEFRNIEVKDIARNTFLDDVAYLDRKVAEFASYIENGGQIPSPEILDVAEENSSDAESVAGEPSRIASPDEDDSVEDDSVLLDPPKLVDDLDLEAFEFVPDSNYLVQLGAFETEAEAKSAWDETLLVLGRLGEGARPVIVEARSGGKVFFRLRLSGFASDEDARKFCVEVTKVEVMCIPVVVAGP